MFSCYVVNVLCSKNVWLHVLKDIKLAILRKEIIKAGEETLKLKRIVGRKLWMTGGILQLIDDR